VSVGYGDILSKNSLERCYSCLVMIIGALGFSILTSSVSSFVQNYDNENQLL